MDYSLLLGIEVLKKRSKSVGHVHKMGYRPDLGNSEVGDLLTDRQTLGSSGYQELVAQSRSTMAPSSKREAKSAPVDPGELMSIKHCFVNSHRVYHIAIIDYLQEWNLNKKLERFTKTVLLGKNKENLSAIEPETYGKRFKSFMEKNVLL